MTTYLLITSDKPTELTAFVGPKEPRFIPIELDCSNRTDSLNSLRLRDEWDLKMETAKASRLPVVNAQEAGLFQFGEWKEWGFMSGKELKLDTTVELEGWEVEVVMSDGWQPTYNNPDNSGLEQPSEPIAYRLKRSEPVKELPEECQDPIASIGGCVFGGSSKNYCKKCVNESPIEVKTQEIDHDGKLGLPWFLQPYTDRYTNIIRPVKNPGVAA